MLIRVIPSYHPAAVLRQWELRAITVQDLRRVAREAGGQRVEKPEWKFQLRPHYDDVIATLNDLLSRLASGPLPISYDIETNYGHILCLGLAWSRLDAICIPFTETQRGGGHYWLEHEEVEIVQLLARVMTHPNFRGITQNGLYDCQYIFRAWHFIPRHSFDTMLGHHSCFSTMPKSLDFLSSMYNDYHVYWKGIARGLNADHGVKTND